MRDVGSEENLFMMDLVSSAMYSWATCADLSVVCETLNIVPYCSHLSKL